MTIPPTARAATPAGAPGSVPRFGQLTYTSFDRAGTGGWQIKGQSGNLTSAEREFLRSQVSTQFDAGIELPQFPTPEQIAVLPRRLVYGPVGDQASAFWHTAPAGNDGTGRPGNIFAHAVLDRHSVLERGQAPAEVRPIDLWRSPGWLTPFGAQQVLGAELGTEARPGAGSAITIGSVVDFLLDPQHWRLGVLGALLDACHAALAGGRRVVLATADVDHAALWIGAVSHLMSAATAHRLFFSTLDRASALDSCWARGLHLVCVPIADLRALGRSQPGAVVIGENESVMMGDLHGEPHVTERGDRIVATPWSVMAQVVLADAGAAQWALGQIDPLVTEVGSTGQDPAWPIAMVISKAPDAFADAAHEAARVITHSSPDELRAVPVLFEQASQIVGRTLGDTAAQAWHGLQALIRPSEPLGVMGELGLNHYLLLAVRDVEWLTRPESVPLPEPGQLRHISTPGVVETAIEQADALRVGSAALDSASAADGEVAAIAVARLADLLVRIGQLTREAAAHIGTAMEHVLFPLLFDAVHGPRLVAAIGRLGDDVQKLLIRPRLGERNHADVGALQVPPEVMSWLFPAGDASALPTDIWAQSLSPYDQLRAERARQEFAAGRATAADRALLAWELLLSGRMSTIDYWESLIGSEPWPARDLIAFVRRWRTSVLPADFLQRGLIAAPWDDDLDALCELITGRDYLRADPGKHDATWRIAAFRRQAVRRWWLLDKFDFDRARQIMLRGGADIATFAPESIGTETMIDLQTALLIGVFTIGDPPRMPIDKLDSKWQRQLTKIAAVVVGDGAVVDPQVLPRVVDWLDRSQSVSFTDLVVKAIAGDPAFPQVAVLGSVPQAVHRLMVAGDKPRPALVEAARVLSAGTTQNQVIEAVHRALTPLAYRDESKIKKSKTFITGWVRALYPKSRLPWQK